MKRRPLLQPDGVPLLCGAGLETTLVFHQGIDLPGFAAFDPLPHWRCCGRVCDGSDQPLPAERDPAGQE